MQFKSCLQSQGLTQTLKSTRRRALAWLIAGSAAAIYELSSRRARGADSAKATSPTTVRMKSVLEVKGNVLLKDLRGKKPTDRKSAPIESKSTLEFEESYHVDAMDSVNGVAMQNFAIAELESVVDKHETKLSLRESCRDIVKKVSESGVATSCFEHPLTASERDLVQGPVNTMFLDLLLPTKSVELGDRWDLRSEIAMRLFQLDSIRSGKIQIVASDAKDALHQLEIDGELQGIANEVATHLKISGKAQVDRQQGLVTWLALSIHEEREVGESEPGFAIQARLRILREKIEHLSSGQSLDDFAAAIEKLDPSTQLIQFDSKPGAYRFVADRHWTTILDNGVDATLKLVQNNRTVAYCTITNLADMEPGRQLSLEGYQEDIKKTIGKHFAQFQEADERLSSTGLRMMRVVALGQVEGVQVTWINILLSNDGGRHLSLAYTLNQSNFELFGTHDLQMAGSLEFSLRQLPAAPQEEPKNEPKVDAKSASGTSKSLLTK